MVVNDNKELRTAIERYFNTSHFDKVRRVLDFFENMDKVIKVERSTMANPSFIIQYLATNSDYTKMNKYSLKRRFIVGFLFWTGVRVSEFVSTKRSQVDLISRTYNVKTLKQKKEVFRAIPLDHVPAKELKIWQHYFEVFDIKLDDTIAQSSRRNVERAVKHELGVNAHALRHALGLYLYELTKDIRIVSIVLRHTNVANTMIYTRLSLDAVREKLRG